jgi:hypothetical protein
MTAARAEWLTITLRPELADKVRRNAETEGSVSAYIAHLVDKEPDWAEARAVADELIAEHGEPGPEAEAWAREVLGIRGTPDLHRLGSGAGRGAWQNRWGG